MLMQFDCGPRSSAVLLLAALALGGAAIRLQAQMNAAAPQGASVQVPVYEVVSIKPASRVSAAVDGRAYTTASATRIGCWSSYQAANIRL